MSATIINGVTYDWHSIEVQANGVATPEIKEISYKEAGKRTRVYGTPRNAVGRTGGKSEPEASITMYKAQWERFKAELGNGFGLVEFDVLINYSEAGQDIVTDELLSCTIEEVETSPSQGDDPIEVKLALSVLRMKHNGLEMFVEDAA
jgi:hypothetical protein